MSQDTRGVNTLKSNRNERAVIHLKHLGYPMPNIRKSLHKLTGLTQPEIARRIGMSRQTVTHAIEGLRCNPKVRSAIAEIWDIPVDVLFDDQTKDIPDEAA